MRQRGVVMARKATALPYTCPVVLLTRLIENGGASRATLTVVVDVILLFHLWLWLWLLSLGLLLLRWGDVPLGHLREHRIGGDVPNLVS